MKLAYSILLLFSMALQLGASPLAVLASVEGDGSQELGHVFVFSAKEQKVSMRFIKTGEFTAKLYQEAQGLTADTGQSVVCNVKAGELSTITLDLPESSAVVNYRLVFTLEDKPSLRITSLPLDYLNKLKERCSRNPLVLVAPPVEFVQALQSSGVQYTVANAAAKNTQLLISFRAMDKDAALAGRNIMVSTRMKLNRETWVHLGDERWKVYVPQSEFPVKNLDSAAGQAYLMRLLLDEPPRF